MFLVKNFLGIMMLGIFLASDANNCSAMKEEPKNEKMEDVKKCSLTEELRNQQAQDFLKTIGYNNLSKNEKSEIRKFLQDQIKITTAILQGRCSKEEERLERMLLEMPFINPLYETSYLQIKNPQSDEKMEYTCWVYASKVHNNVISAIYAQLKCWTKGDKNNFLENKNCYGPLAQCFSNIKEIVPEKEFDKRLNDFLGNDGMLKQQMAESKCFTQTILSLLEKDEKKEKII